MTDETIDQRLATVNAALQLFAKDTVVLKGDRGWVVQWSNWKGEPMTRRWAAQGFYPVWERKWGHGGTCCMALTTLMRWLQGRPVFGLSTWEYWLSPTIKLAGGNEALLQLLKDGGYPQAQICIRCGQEIEKGAGLDWWTQDGESGPACQNSWTCGRLQENQNHDRRIHPSPNPRHPNAQPPATSQGWGD